MKILTTILIGIAAMTMAACGQKEKTGEQAQAAMEQTQETAQAATAEHSAVLQLSSIDEMPNNGKLTVIDFNATWCGPCKRFAPQFEETAKEFAGQANFISVDVDNFPELAKQYEVQSIPHVAFVMPDGKVDSAIGTDQLADFSSLVKAHLQ